MHCSRCKSLMAETERQVADQSLVSWHQCPVCGHEQLHAQRLDRHLVGEASMQAPYKTQSAYGRH